MIYILDTNVLSEVMRQETDPAVVTWLRGCPSELTFTTAISQSEIFYGIRLLAEGARRRRLDRAAQAMFSQEFFGRILPFDSHAAEAHADLRLLRRHAGLPISQEDSMIAAIARIRNATVVTRDIGGIIQCGVSLVDPWTAATSSMSSG